MVGTEANMLEDSHSGAGPESERALEPLHLGENLG